MLWSRMLTPSSFTAIHTRVFSLAVWEKTGTSHETHPQLGILDYESFVRKKTSNLFFTSENIKDGICTGGIWPWGSGYLLTIPRWEEVTFSGHL